MREVRNNLNINFLRDHTGSKLWKARKLGGSALHLQSNAREGCKVDAIETLGSPSRLISWRPLPPPPSPGRKVKEASRTRATLLRCPNRVKLLAIQQISTVHRITHPPAFYHCFNCFPSHSSFLVR